MNRIGITGLIVLTAGLLVSGCSQDMQSTEGADYLLAGYYMLAGDETALEEGAVRATAPLHNAALYPTPMTYADLVAGGEDFIKFVNYPEQGQKSFVTVTSTDDPTVFLIKLRTEYPRQEDTIDYYLEEYYMKDSGDTIWNKDDNIVAPNGTLDSKYRKSMEVVFKDGSIRKEWIADVASRYAAFDISGDLTFPDAGWTGPALDATAGYSSAVHYYQKINNWISWFYKENKELFGVRYYTETGDPLNPDRFSLAYEHLISQDTPLTEGNSATIPDMADWIFNKGAAGGASGVETLAKTVIRYQITAAGNKKKTVVSATEVFPTFGDSFTLNNEIAY